MGSTAAREDHPWIYESLDLRKKTAPLPAAPRPGARPRARPLRRQGARGGNKSRAFGGQNVHAVVRGRRRGQNQAARPRCGVRAGRRAKGCSGNGMWRFVMLVVAGDAMGAKHMHACRGPPPRDGGRKPSGQRNSPPAAAAQEGRAGPAPEPCTRHWAGGARPRRARQPGARRARPVRGTGNGPQRQTTGRGAGPLQHIPPRRRASGEPLVNQHARAGRVAPRD